MQKDDKGFRMKIESRLSRGLMDPVFNQDVLMTDGRTVME